MSSNTKNTIPAPAAGSTDAMLTPESVVQQLRALRAQIPLPEPATATAAPVVPNALRRRLAHVNADFVHASINAAGASDVVQQALGRTDEDLRQEADAAARWTAVADELRSLLHSILIANTLRRQRVGLAALRTYKICEQLVRDEGHARLRPHIVEMKRFNKFGRPRRKPAPPAEPDAKPKTA